MKPFFIRLWIVTQSCASLVYAAAIVERPVITSVAVGGGAGILEFGTEGVVSGIVVGQSYAQLPTKEIQHGFWIEIANLPGTSPVVSATQLHSSINAKFNAHSIAIEFTMPVASSVSIRILDLQGKQAMTPWTGRVSAGVSQLQVPVYALGSQAMILVIQSGSSQKTYRFTPKKIK